MNYKDIIKIGNEKASTNKAKIASTKCTFYFAVDERLSTAASFPAVYSDPHDLPHYTFTLHGAWLDKTRPG